MLIHFKIEAMICLISIRFPLSCHSHRWFIYSWWYSPIWFGIRDASSSSHISPLFDTIWSLIPEVIGIKKNTIENHVAARWMARDQCRLQNSDGLHGTKLLDLDSTAPASGQKAPRRTADPSPSVLQSPGKNWRVDLQNLRSKRSKIPLLLYHEGVKNKLPNWRR